MRLLSYRAFSTELMKIATEVRDPDIRAMVADAHGKEYMQGGRLATNTEIETNFKPKIAARFVVDAHGPIGTNTPYERASNYVSSGLRGAMTGAGAGALLHTLRHGHEMKLEPFHLGGWMAGGAALGLADHALRHHFRMRQLQRMGQQEAQQPGIKQANLSSSSFSPSRELQASQQRGSFENKVHRGVVSPAPAATIGKIGRLPTQGV